MAPNSGAAAHSVNIAKEREMSFMHLYLSRPQHGVSEAHRLLVRGYGDPVQQGGCGPPRRHVELNLDGTNEGFAGHISHARGRYAERRPTDRDRTGAVRRAAQKSDVLKRGATGGRDYGILHKAAARNEGSLVAFQRHVGELTALDGGPIGVHGLVLSGMRTVPPPYAASAPITF